MNMAVIDKFVMVTDKDVAEYKLSKIMDGDDFSKRISSTSLEMGFALPLGTVAIRYTKNKKEDKIQYLVIKNRIREELKFMNGETKKLETYDVTWPQIVFNMEYNVATSSVIMCEMYMLDPRTQVNEILPGTKIPLYALPIANIGSDNTLCPDTRHTKDPIMFMHGFYVSDFNDDLSSNIKGKIPKKIYDEFVTKYESDDGVSTGKIMEWLLEKMKSTDIEWVKVAELSIPAKFIDIGGKESWNIIKKA